MSKAKDNKLIEEFYKLYSDIDRTAGLTQAKKKRLERFRNEMAVDFYNISDDNDVSEFSKKYQYSNIPMPNMKVTFGECQTLGMIEELKIITEEKYEIGEHEILLNRIDQDNYYEILLKNQEIFITIVDKVIEGQKLSKDELAYIQEKFFGLIIQSRLDSGCYQLNHTTFFPLASFWVLNRALYEWVLLLSRGLVSINRCKEPTCKRLYIPTARGHDQKYCKNSCKMKSFRKKVLLDKKKYGNKLSNSVTH